MVEVICINCGYYIKGVRRGIPCKKGHSTIVPYNISCDNFILKATKRVNQ